MSELPGVNQENDERMVSVFDTLLKPPVAKMQERVFVENFLPFLNPKGLPKEHVEQMLATMEARTGNRHTEKDLIGNMMNQWLEYTGNPYIECEVYDQEGKHIFTVPALFQRQDIIKETDAARLPELIENAYNQSRVLPMMGTNFINQHISPLFHHPTLTAEFIKQWNVIFERYGMELLPSPDTPVKNDAEADVIIEDDIFYYD